MFKLIKALGKLVVKLYNAEARRLNAKAKGKAKLAQGVALRYHKLYESSIENTGSAAKVAAQAQQLSKFFE